MSELDDKLTSILGNPELMTQIMNMAKSLGQSAAAPSPKAEPEPEQNPAFPDLDPALIGRIMNLAGQSGIDRNQMTLLKALQPYLSAARIHKLEKAMRAAKLAGAASVLLQSGSISFLPGR